METMPLQRIANVIGFVAYNIAVGGGVPNRELLAAALQRPAAGLSPAATPQARPTEPTARPSTA